MNEIVEGYMRPCDVCGGSGDIEDGDYYKYCEACDGTGIYKAPAAPEQGAISPLVSVKMATALVVDANGKRYVVKRRRLRLNP